MPYQKNCVPSVAMKEGMPILATSTPLMKPTRTPAARATTTPSHWMICRRRRGEPVRSKAESRDDQMLTVLEDEREDEAGEADDRREAEVDLAGADDEGQARRRAG